MKLNRLKNNPLMPFIYGIEKMGLVRFSDEFYLKNFYKYKFGKSLNLSNPITYNEKLQWLKLNDRKPIYTIIVDKYEVKKYVASIIGDEYIVPMYGVYDSFDDIDFNKLPNEFVLKCTHDSGGVIVVKDKTKLNLKSIKKKINKLLKRNFYYNLREWPYKNIKPRIIIEKYMEDDKFHELRDYKFFCFEGTPKLMFVASNRQGVGDTYFDFFDMDYNHLNIINGHPNAPVLPEKPENFSKMIEFSKKLSKFFFHIRVDFYEINGKLYFGELTLYHWSGMITFEPEKWDKTLGEWIDLNNLNSKDNG